MKLLKFTYKKVMSTNDVAIRKIRSGIEQGIIITNEQKKGRGRFGNKWISLKGNLFTTIFYKVNSNYNLKKITQKNCLLIFKTLKTIYFDSQTEKFDINHDIGLKISLLVSTVIILIYFIYPSPLQALISKIVIL